MRAQYEITTGLTLAIIVATLGWRTNDASSMRAPLRDECSAPGAPTRTPVDTVTDLRLTLNVPAFRLDVVERGAVTRSLRVAVGQPKYRTPIGRFRMDYVVWNPWWRPPPSDWARKERPQPPGWSNPVGRVKLHVTGLVFLHGTPFEDSRGTAASHACVRLANADAIELAKLVHSYAGPPMPATLLDDLIADTSATRTVVLSRAVPVDIDYVLAEVREGDLVLYPDVYRYAGRRVPSVEEQAVRALRSVRGDSADIDVARLRTMARAARRAIARLPLDSLITPRK